MAITDPEQIKKIVCGNFDRSPELYERFESEHNVFRDLTLRLADLCGIAPGMTIIDAGCGTGSSTFPLADIVGPGGRVVGIVSTSDIIRTSPAQLGLMEEMLDVANLNAHSPAA